MVASAGLVLWYVGGNISLGSDPEAAAIAAWTSCAALVMSRLRSNCMVIDVRPDELVDVIWVTPDTAERVVSSGVATVVAIVSALAPGKLAETWMVGKSTCGNEATGNATYAMTPSKLSP